jgi:putative flavoprotein involved in K+ transport
VETVIIGGGQAGLALAYELQQRGRHSIILNASRRVGDSWRERWDSLRLFTPATLSHLPGMKQPRAGWAFATKDEFADYLEAYVTEFRLDVRNGVRAERIVRSGDHYLVDAGDERLVADHVVLATGAYQDPKVPVFAPELSPAIRQMHSSAYRNPRQLEPGEVLVVGGGNSGAEIALELAETHSVRLSGSAPVFPVRPGSLPSRVFMPLFLFAATRLLTTHTPMGRRLRPHARNHAAPILRAKPGDLVRAGVQRVPRIAGVRDGLPVTEDGQRLDVDNVIWCTGFQSDFSWIDLPSFRSGEEPEHERGVILNEPGMYFIGQLFQYALASSFIGGVGRDAGYIAKVIDRRVAEANARPVAAVV